MLLVYVLADLDFELIVGRREEGAIMCQRRLSSPKSELLFV